MVNGILLIDKPVGITSNRAVGIVRRRLGRSVKVGHTGTLDPAASGLLVILAGTATRALDFLDETKKRYKVTIRLGEESDTCDSEGTIVVTGNPSNLSAEQIGSCLKEFEGPIDQLPPHFSAIKKDGVPLYRLARKGIFPNLEKRKVEIFKISVIEWRAPDLNIDLICSKGTYARSLARDIGICLRVGGRVETLRRIASGSFDVNTAHSIDFIENAPLNRLVESRIELAEALKHIPQLDVSQVDLEKLACGVWVDYRPEFSGDQDTNIAPGDRLYRVQDADGLLVIMVRVDVTGEYVRLKPVKVFNAFTQGAIEQKHE